MVTGIALVGLVTGALASWFVERVSASAKSRAEKQDTEVAAELRALREEIDALRKLVVRVP